MTARSIVVISALVVMGVGAGPFVHRHAPAGTTIIVYKSASCGCCAKWIDHLRTAGYTVEVHDTENLDEVMTNFAVPRQLASCHTAKVGPYVVEGHVPADLIAKALREHPAIAGLAVPGMVTGSPGMEGGTPQHYDVVAWTTSGQTSVYAHR